MGGTCIYMYVRVYCTRTPVHYPPVHTVRCKMGVNGSESTRVKKHNELSYHFYICTVRTVSNHSFFSKT